MSALPGPVSPELVLVDPELAQAERHHSADEPAPRAPARRGSSAARVSERRRYDLKTPVEAVNLGRIGSIAALTLSGISLLCNGLLASTVIADRHRARAPVVVTSTKTLYDTTPAHLTPFVDPDLPPPNTAAGTVRQQVAG